MIDLNREDGFPRMHRVIRRFDSESGIEVDGVFKAQWEKMKSELNLASGSSVAVCVGSRGITDVARIAALVVAGLKEAGLEPFITSAMGSHGGASVQGQMDVLAHLGVSEETMGAPVRVTMEVERVGEVNGIPIFLDRLAHQADGIVLINRIKPHTDFIGATESGLIKMMAIGLGNHIGADCYHRLAVARDMYEIINTAGTELIKRSRVLFGVALVENQVHQTALLKLIPGDRIPAVEPELLPLAREYFPQLPLDRIDLLIIDQIGKDFSGAGMDPIVTGRRPCFHCPERARPKISRIFVRDLSPASEGNACGIGQAEFTTQRLVDKVDWEKTAINGITACCPEDCRKPLTYPNDRAALQTALKTLRPVDINELKIVQIKNTLELEHLLVSEGCLPDLTGDCIVEPEGESMVFDRNGDLVSEFE